MKVEGELGSDPLVSTLPARPVQEDIVAVLRHVFDQVVGEAQVCSGQTQHLSELGVLDLDTSFFHLKQWSIKKNIKYLHFKKLTQQFHTRRTYFDDGVTEVPLLTEEDVGCSGDKASHRHVWQEVMLLQRHVGQAQVTLETRKDKGRCVYDSRTPACLHPAVWAEILMVNY